GGSHHRAAATRSAFLSGGRAAVAPDTADQEWSSHRRLHDDRLSHLCWCGARPARSVGASGPCGEALRTRGPPHPAIIAAVAHVVCRGLTLRKGRKCLMGFFEYPPEREYSSPASHS